MYHCGFVALSVQMCVAGANKVEGTMSLCLGTNEILASNHDIISCAKGQTRALCWDCHFGSSQFGHLLLWLKVFRSIPLKYLHDWNAEYWDAAV